MLFHLPWMMLSQSDFNTQHHNDWLTYSVGTDRPGELCYNVSISNDFAQMVNFPTQIPVCDSPSFAFLDLYLSYSSLSLHWEILIVLMSNFPMTFHETQKGIFHFIA